jgi:hypothetical protein
MQPMDTDKLQQIQVHARAIAALLYEETAPEQLATLEGIEAAVRGQIGRACQSRNRKFFIATASGTSSGRRRQLKSILGEITITENQAKALEVKARTQLSPYLEKCCVDLSAPMHLTNEQHRIF